MLHLDKSIDNYLYRHLHANRDYRRTTTFLKMLRIAIKEELVKESVTVKTRKHAASLSKVRSGSLEPVEIFPYDQLWGLVLNTL